MCDKFPIEEKVVTVKKSHFDGVGVVGGIDRGCTLTKVLFSTEKDTDHYNLHFALFKNQAFDVGLDYLKDKGFVVQQPGAKLHVTGAGCDKYRDVIKEKVGLEIQFIDEFLTQGRGTHWLISSVGDEQLCYPDPHLDPDEVADFRNNNFIRNLLESWKREIGEIKPDQKFPCLMLFVGSGAGILKLEEDGTADMIGGLWFAGRSFLGMSKMLLGTDDYDEIMRLAENGDPRKLDTQAHDVLANDPSSPYGSFPKDFPVFSFGKVVDTDKGLSDYSREDVASSLVFSFAYNAFTSLTMAARTTKIGKMYMGGNFFRHEIIRKLIFKQVAMFSGIDDNKDENAMSLKFIKTGHTGAIGAMISKPEDVMKYLAFMKQQQQQQQQQ